MKNHSAPLLAFGRRTKMALVAVGGLLLLIAGVLGIRQTTWYFYHHQVPRTLEDLLIHSLMSEDQEYILASLAEADPDLAYAIIGRLENPQIQDVAYALLVEAWTDSLRIAAGGAIPPGAQDAAARIGDVRYASAALQSLAVAAAQLGDTASALDFVQQAGQHAAGISDAATKCDTYVRLAYSARKSGEEDMAAVFLQQAVSAAALLGEPSEQFYTLPIGPAVEMQDRECLLQAAKLAGQMQEADWQFTTLHRLTLAAAQMRDTALASIFLEQSAETVFRVESLNLRAGEWLEVALAAAEIGNTALASGYLQRALDAIRRITDESFKGYILGEAALAAAQTKDASGLQQVGQAGKSIAGAVERARFLRTYALAKAQLGAQAGALRYLRQSVGAAAGIVVAGDRASALRDAALAFAELGDTLSAAQYLRQSAAAAGRVHFSPSRYMAYTETAMAAAQIRSLQSLQLGLEIAGHIESAYHQFLALDEVAAAAYQVSDQEVFQQVVDAAARLEDAQWQAAIFRNMSDYLYSSGDTLQSRKLLLRACQAAAGIRGDGVQAESLDEIAQTAVQTGNTEALRAALQATHRLKDPEIQSEILRVFLKAADRLGDRRSIEEIAARVPGIPGREYQAPIQEALTAVYLHSGEFRRAYQTARSMPDKNARWKALAYVSLLKGWKERVGLRIWGWE